jgi:class 3 adenylate cyclase/ABC-type transport system substrate-binding protein
MVEVTQAMRERRLAAIFFSDMKGFSAQMDADEEGTLQRLDLHNDLMRQNIANHAGRVVKTVGDAFMAEFSSSVSAVECALDCQRALSAHNQERAADEAIEVRIGVHVGDVVVEGTDLFGEAVNMAARLEPQAPVGAVCVSEAVYAQVRRKVRAAGSCRDRVCLKGLEEPVRLVILRPSNALLDIVDAAPRRRPWIALGLGVAVSLLAAVTTWWTMGSWRPSPDPAPPGVQSPAVLVAGGTLRAGWQGDWGSLQPGGYMVTVSAVALDMVYEPLVHISTSGLASPWVLEHAEEAQDGRSLVLRLRPDLAFHPSPCLREPGGRLADASDLLASLALHRRQIDPLPVLGAAGSPQTLPPEGARITGEREVTVFLSHPVPYAVHALSNARLVPAELVAEPCTLPAGSGPFAVTGSLVGNTLPLSRFDAYWGRAPRIERIELTAVEDIVGALGLLGKGELDLLALYRSDVFVDPRAERPVLAPRYHSLDVAVAPWVRSHESAAASVLFLAGPESGWGDPSARKALAYALDRAELVDVYPTAMVASGRYLESRVLGSDPALEGFVHDPDLARSLLAEAVESRGEALPALLLGAKRDRWAVAERLKVQANAIGLDVVLRPLTGAGMEQVFRERSLDAVLIESIDPLIGNDPYVMVGQLSFLFHRAGDELPDSTRQLMDRIEDAAREIHRPRRVLHYEQIERGLFEQVPYVPIGFRSPTAPVASLLLTPRVHGVVASTTGRVEAQQWEAIWSHVWLSEDSTAPTGSVSN